MTSALEKLESKLDAISKQIEIAEEEIKQLEAKKGALKDLYEIKEIIVLALAAVKDEVDRALEDSIKDQEEAEKAEMDRMHSEQKSYADLMLKIKDVDREGVAIPSMLSHARMCGYTLEALDEPTPA